MKQNIAVIMGGYSSEYNISMISGNVVYNHIDQTKYEPYRVVITKEKWVALNHKDQEFNIDKNDFSAIIEGTKINFDCVFNVIHGTPGEDGKILGYFDMIDLPYSSAPAYQMALTFNKRDCLSVLRKHGINTAKSLYFDEGDDINPEKIVNELGLPCFVKPNNAGSSYGISKVNKIEEFSMAFEKAFKEDHEILIESFLDGTEVSIGVITYQNEVVALPATEIVSENDFFDYEAKYEGKSQEITPARISDIQLQNLHTEAIKAYKALNMSGFSRSEFIFIGDTPYFLEMNTVPGMTTGSLLPQQAKAAGIPLPDLLTNAIEMAIKNK
ncbi:D-alanine--D-alanine ligase [Wenyingzhuangia marina]|uniref:D-alanine--D-alanine ligase n=1 Tax=Wenyingzhuangia marina TaxID=1195760 RepID=A0A1M5UL70_9FLAO|nr:D-alanine--D-alanine ligase [Wenyingzhuangia marina]GGF67151.1 D-alanine--D-alanine ligase [Wenyingzhuangia marina]SHH63423.1 D-alanine-D-alanine ligase [Wenyingzhuangia marina]